LPVRSHFASSCFRLTLAATQPTSTASMEPEVVGALYWGPEEDYIYCADCESRVCVCYDRAEASNSTEADCGSLVCVRGDRTEDSNSTEVRFNPIRLSRVSRHAVDFGPLRVHPVSRQEHIMKAIGLVRIEELSTLGQSGGFLVRHETASKLVCGAVFSCKLMCREGPGDLGGSRVSVSAETPGKAGPKISSQTASRYPEEFVKLRTWDPLGVQLYRISIGGSSWGSRSRSSGARRGFKGERTHLSPFGPPKMHPRGAFWRVQKVKDGFFHL